MTDEQELGAWGEAEAARFLKGKGLTLLERGFQTRWGEIDLIFRERDTIVFVEVKTRQNEAQPSAADSITPGKQKKLVNAALSYMKKHRLEDDNIRFDAVLIEAGHLEWIPGAFDVPPIYTR